VVASGGLPASRGEGLRHPSKPGSTSDRRRAADNASGNAACDAACAAATEANAASKAAPSLGVVAPLEAFAASAAACCSASRQGEPKSGGGRVSTTKAGKLPSPASGDGRRAPDATRWDPCAAPAPDALRARRKAASQFT
jgi:hypothetical protein